MFFEMREIDAADILALADARRGHFRMESGYHTAQWLHLEPLFVHPDRIQPIASALARLLEPAAPNAICGPLVGGAFVAQLVANELGCELYFTERVDDLATPGLFRARYRLPPSLARRVTGRRVAIVDDVISAGSSARATFAALHEANARVVAVGALLLMGDAAPAWFADFAIPVVASARTAFEIWPPESCPLCAANIPVENPASDPPA